MKKLSKIIRILTIAPIIAAVMLTIIYLTRPEQMPTPDKEVFM